MSRLFPFLLLLPLLLSCQSGDDQAAMQAADEAAIKGFVVSLNAGLREAYVGAPINIDSLFAVSFDSGAYYITPWGTSEPVDSTRERLKRVIPLINNYEVGMENLTARSFGNAGYAWFILRQRYTVNGNPLDEYLPTTYVLRRTDDGWRIVHLQRSTDMQTFQQYVDLQKRMAAGRRSK